MKRTTNKKKKWWQLSSAFGRIEVHRLHMLCAATVGALPYRCFATAKCSFSFLGERCTLHTYARGSSSSIVAISWMNPQMQRCAREMKEEGAQKKKTMDEKWRKSTSWRRRREVKKGNLACARGVRTFGILSVRSSVHCAARMRA